MKRLLLAIGSALLFIGGANSLLAQHSGGGHSSGGHASVGHSGGSFGSGHSHSGSSNSGFSTLSGHYPSAGQLVYPTPIGLQPQYSGYTGINRGALQTGGRGGRLGGRGYGSYGGYFLSPYYYSGFDDYDNSGGYYYNRQGQDEAAQTATVSTDWLGEQIAQLSGEVDALRNERENGNEPPQSRIPYRAPPAMAEDEAPSAPPLTLVLRSGRQVQLKSYAVMGQDIWDFSVQPARRIALSTVDVSASKNASEASGAEFPDIH